MFYNSNWEEFFYKAHILQLKFVIKTEFVDENKNTIEIGPKIKSCYLTSITTNFNPSSMAFHRDGEPVEIDLSLNFTEETTLNKQDILDGF